MLTLMLVLIVLTLLGFAYLRGEGVGGPLLTMYFGPRTITTNKQWRASLRALDDCWPCILAKDNDAVNGTGKTVYGKIEGGTILAKDSGGSFHPCGLIEVASVVSSSHDVIVDDDRNFYVGDLVKVVQAALTVDVAVTGEADNDVFSSGSVPHGLNVGDRVSLAGLTGGTGAVAGSYVVGSLGGDQAYAITGVAATDVITTDTVHGLKVGDRVSLSALTGGAGVAAGDFIVQTVPSTTTLTLVGVNFTTDITVGTLTAHRDPEFYFSLTGVAFTTDITAGTVTRHTGEPTFAQITTAAREVTAINRSTHTLTLDGATFSAAVGDLVIKTGAYKPEGVLTDTVSTKKFDIDGTEVDMDLQVTYSYQADLRRSFCPGRGAYLEKIMAGGPYIDPLNPGVEVVPEHAGFIFKDF